MSETTTQKLSFLDRSLTLWFNRKYFPFTVKSHSRSLVSSWFPGSGAENYVASADIEATKPL